MVGNHVRVTRVLLLALAVCLAAAALTVRVLVPSQSAERLRIGSATSNSIAFTITNRSPSGAHSRRHLLRKSTEPVKSLQMSPGTAGAGLSVLNDRAAELPEPRTQDVLISSRSSRAPPSIAS